MTNWRLMVGIFALPQFISLFLFAWMLSSSQSGPLCMPQTYSKILFICLISLSPLPIMNPPLCFSVHVLHIIHTSDVFLFGRFTAQSTDCTCFSNSISVLFIVFIQLYVYSFQIVLCANTGISYELCFSSLLETEVYVLYLYFSCLSLLISSEPVQITM